MAVPACGGDGVTGWSAVGAIGGGEGGVEVLCGFEADCEPDESVVAERGGEGGCSRLGVVLVGDECLVVSERHRRGDEAQVVDEAHTVFVLARDGEGDDSSIVAVELGGCAGVLGVAREAGVGDVGYPAVAGEEAGDCLRVLAVPLQAPMAAPPMASPWPLKYLVSEWMTRSAPRSSGRSSGGGVKVESIVRSAPLAWAISASGVISATRRSGLAITSVWMRRVLGRTAARTASRSVISTKSTSIPSLAGSRESKSPQTRM